MAYTSPYATPTPEVNTQPFDMRSIFTGIPGAPMAPNPNQSFNSASPTVLPMDAGGNGLFSGFGDWAFGADGKGGNLAPTLQGVGSLTNAVLGYKTLGLGRDKYNRAIKESDLNFANQATSYNTQLENAKRNQLIGEGGSGAAGSPELLAALQSYLNQNAIKGKV